MGTLLQSPNVLDSHVRTEPGPALGFLHLAQREPRWMPGQGSGMKKPGRVGGDASL